MKRFVEKYHFTILMILILALIVPIWFEIKIDFENFDFLWLSVYVICAACFAYLIEKSLVYFVCNDPQIKEIKLSLHNNLKKLDLHFDDVRTIITHKRNISLCKKMGYILLKPTIPEDEMVDIIQKHIETGDIFDVISKINLSRKEKRFLFRYIDLYDNNTNDLVDVKTLYEQGALLKNEVDIKTIIGIVSSIVIGVIGWISLEQFTNGLSERIIGIILFLVIETVYVFEQYHDKKIKYIEYYSNITKHIELAYGHLKDCKRENEQ